MTHIPEGETVIALLIGLDVYAFAVLLVPSRRRSGKYERIGITSTKQEHFKYAEEMVLDII